LISILNPFYGITLVIGQKAENPFPGMSVCAFILIGKITFFKHFPAAESRVRRKKIFNDRTPYPKHCSSHKMVIR
jgi:hypothetical protein